MRYTTLIFAFATTVLLLLASACSVGEREEFDASDFCPNGQVDVERSLEEERCVYIDEEGEDENEDQVSEPDPEPNPTPTPRVQEEDEDQAQPDPTPTPDERVSSNNEEEAADSDTTWVNEAPDTGFEANTNFVEASTCGEPETEAIDGVEYYVIETNLEECPDGMFFQTSKLGQVNVRLVVEEGQAAHVDGYDVNGRPGVFKGFGPGEYNLTVSDGAVKLGSMQDARNRHCESLAMARANEWLVATVEPLDGWTC